MSIITEQVGHPESCRACGSIAIISNRRVIQGKEIQVRLCNACGAIDLL
jgi:hypothetical protein